MPSRSISRVPVLLLLLFATGYKGLCCDERGKTYKIKKGKGGFNILVGLNNLMIFNDAISN